MSSATTERMPGDPLLRAMGPTVMTRGTKVSDRALIMIVSVVILTAVNGLLRPALTLSGQSIPPLSSPDSQQMAAWAFLAVPVAMYLYFWSPGSSVALIPELRANGVILGPKEGTTVSIDQFEANAKDRYEYAWFFVPGIYLIALYSIVKFRNLPPGSTAATVQLILDLLVAAPVIYAATLSFFRMVAGIRVTTELFDRYRIRVYPYHPDGAGGFGPIGRRVTILAWAGAAAGSAVLFINVLSLQQGNNLLASMESVFGVGALLVVAPLVLWFWLHFPHEAMLTARGTVLGEVGAVYDRVARATIVTSQTPAVITRRLKEGTDLLVELDRRAAEITLTYPAWPIHTTALRTAWAAVAAPLVAGVVGILVSSVRAFFGG